MKQTKTLIVGASAAGLANAACLKKQNQEFIILEKHSHVAHAWRNHYDRLHLHTNKSSSQLPFVKYPSSVSKFPSKNEVVEYFDQYKNELGINIEFNTTVQKIQRENELWKTTTDNSSYLSENVILCTGYTNIPNRVTKPGLENFPGKVLHSSEYKNGEEFKDQKVLVIGFGNSACEIAICLHEHGAKPALSVRSPVNVIPRDILGIPVLQIGIAMSKFPPRIIDKMNQPLLKFLIGDIEKYGLKKLPYGPTEQIVHHHQIPLLDIGTMELIKNGKIKVHGDIQEISKNKVKFENGSTANFDAIIMGTGWETGLEKLLSLSQDRWEDMSRSYKSRTLFGEDNLYFCGFYVSPTGMLREIGIEAKAIAQKISKNS